MTIWTVGKTTRARQIWGKQAVEQGIFGRFLFFKADNAVKCETLPSSLGRQVVREAATIAGVTAALVIEVVILRMLPMPRLTGTKRDRSRCRDIITVRMFITATHEVSR